jgi:exosortase
VEASADDSSAQSWRVHGIALALLILLILLEFRSAVVDAVEVWWVYATYSHCFLVIPISLWLVWEKRDQLSRLTPVVELRPLWAAPVLLVAWWMGELATINELRQFAIVGLIEVAIVAMLGPRVYRQIWFPALYLFFFFIYCF